MKVAALTAGRTTPSARFRVRQYVAPLAAAGIEVREWAPAIDKNAPVPGYPDGGAPRPVAALWRSLKIATRLPGVAASSLADVRWVSRELAPGYLTFEPVLRRPLVLDVDDAVWLERGGGSRRAVVALARRAEVVVAGNRYLADFFSDATRDVRVVPTAVDTDRFRPAAAAKKGPGFVVGWTGTSANFRYLLDVEEPLAAFVKSHRDVSLRIVADRAPSLRSVPADRMQFVAWSPHCEVASVAEMDVGLMPLRDDDWTRGKCSFKMLQYMACGVPALVSPVGMNREVLAIGDVAAAATTLDEWREWLEWFYRERESAAALGRAGRTVAEQRFSLAVIAPQLAAILRRAAGTSALP
jgi:glycosyltransferase involved in cell wall biosynthesis